MRVFIRPLVDTPVTPNQVTVLRLLSGLGAAAAFAVGSDFWRFAGAGIFVLSVFLDRADGELARLGGKTTPGGHTFDLIADGVSDTLAFVGIGIGLRDSVFGWWAIPMGLLAGIAVATVFFLVMRIEAMEGRRAAELPGAAGFDPDDAILIVPVAIWLGGALPLLAAAAVGAPAFAVFFFWLFLRKRQT